MKISDSTRYALCVCVAAVLLAGCGSQSLIGALTASRSLPTQRQFSRHFIAPDAVKGGIYVSSFHGTSVLGFTSGYRRGRGPNCLEYIGPHRHLNDVATDPQGNLIIPASAPQEVTVYAGPGMCGSKLGSFRDPYGQPGGGAASFDAAHGTILIADGPEPHRSHMGNIAVCSLKSGCTKMLSNPNNAGLGTGVALAKNGDCWLTSEKKSAHSVAMTYWPGCAGPGKATTGFQGSSTGSLSIDKYGNLVSLDWAGGRSGQMWVYSGCNPACKLVGGPFSLQGYPGFGAFDATGDVFGVIEQVTIGIVDIYKYSPKKLTYEYSFDTGIARSDPLGFAYSPALDE